MWNKYREREIMFIQPARCKFEKVLCKSQVKSDDIKYIIVG